jgi:NitT/TauT family transport system substrate-binding protein
MKKYAKWLSLAICVSVVFISGMSAKGNSDSGKSAAPLEKVRIGVHSNGGGASTIAVAIDQGFFKEAGIDPDVVIVESGPSEMAAMRADNPTLDIGYIGPGVAWNPIDTTGNSLSFVFFDNLGNSERLIAQKGIFSDRNNNGKYDSAELVAGLKGKTVYFEVGTTPGGWFKNLVAAINTGIPTADQLWIGCEDAAYIAGYTAPNNNAANRVLVVNYQNSNIAAGMNTAQGNSRVDIAVAFAPIPGTILKQNSSIEMAADITALPSDKVFPATFVANTRWMREKADLAQRCVNAIYKAAVWRGDNPDQAMRIAENLCQKPALSFSPEDYSFPTAAQYKDWFASTGSAGYGYMRALYTERLPNIPKGTQPKSFEQAIDFSFMLKAMTAR